MSDAHGATTAHDRARQELYDIVETDGDPLTEKQEQILAVGTDYLDVDLGYVATIDTTVETLTVESSTAPETLTPGAEFDLSETYCRKCVASDSAVAVSDSVDEGWMEDPAYRKHGLGCYLGTPLYVDGEMVGTLCFADEDARDPDFSPTEKAFVELAARLVGREREIMAHEQRLAEREAELERRQASIDQTEQKYESLVATAPEAIFLANRASKTLVEVNERAAELTGYTESELVGTRVNALHPDGEAEQYLSVLRESIGEGSTTLDELPNGEPILVEQADGSTVPVEVSATRTTVDGEDHVIAVMRDISERREREEELRLRGRAMDEASVGITIADATGNDLPLVYANEQFLGMTSLEWETIEGENCRFLQGMGTDDETTDDIGAALAAEEPVETEVLNYRADGTPFWNNLQISPVEDENGEVTHFVGFQQDVTDRKRKERLITVLNRVLRHNLRNSMSVVLNRAEQLAEMVDDETPAESIQTRARELVTVSERATDISKAVERESEGPESRDVVPMVEAVADRLDAKYPKATISTAVPHSVEALCTGTLRPALTELGENAVSHSRPEPNVEFAIERTEDGQVAVRVSDDGPGLPPEEQTVLQRGYETPLEHGSGLGLWFVNWVVTGVGGHVTAETDGGTTVSVVLQQECPETEHRQSAFST